MIHVDAHPVADLAVLQTIWPQPIGQLVTPDWLRALVQPDIAPEVAPFSPEVKAAVRDLLRHGGFKPSGRNKPCSEYIRKVADQDRFPWINPAVDACNVAVLHGGLPVSTVDLDRVSGPLRIGIAEVGTRYVFNASGQELDLSGLLALFDSEGACANSVKDCHRTKTHDGTVRTVSVIWGTRDLPGRTEALATWYTSVLERLGGTVTPLL